MLIKGKIRAKNVIAFVATFLLVCLSNGSFTTFIPLAFGILWYKDLPSKDTIKALSGTDFIASSFCKIQYRHSQTRVLVVVNRNSRHVTV